MAWEKNWFKSLLQVRGPWTAHDNGDGCVYYYNRDTHESSWTCPFDDVYELYDVSHSSMARCGVWSMHQSSEDGNIYYYNQNTGKSTWVRPLEFDKSIEYQAQWKVQLQQPPRTQATQPIDATPSQIQAYLDMLQCKVISDSNWDKVLPVLALDVRFTAIPRMEQRKSLFEHFLKIRQSTNGLEQLAKLLATPLAARVLRRNSTLDEFLQQLDATVRERLRKTLEQVDRTQIQQLFQRRLQLIKK